MNNKNVGKFILIQCPLACPSRLKLPNLKGKRTLIKPIIKSRKKEKPIVLLRSHKGVNPFYLAERTYKLLECAFGYRLFYWKLKIIKKSFSHYWSLLKLLFTCLFAPFMWGAELGKKKNHKRSRCRRETNRPIMSPSPCSNKIIS